MKVYGATPAAPVKYIFGEAKPTHTAVVPDIVADGTGLTITTAFPL